MTGQRSHNPLPALRSLFDDPLFGVEVEILSGGTIYEGDKLVLES